MSDQPPKQDLRDFVRSEGLRSDDVIVIRGGPDAVQKILAHARRLNTIYVLDALPVLGVSIVAAMDDLGPASLPQLLATRLASYREVHLPRAGDLIAAGFELLPTFDRPHFTVVLPDASPASADRLLKAVGPASDNPYYQGRRPRRR